MPRFCPKAESSRCSWWKPIRTGLRSSKSWAFGRGPDCTDAIGARVSRAWPFGESTRWASICCRQDSPRGMATLSSSRTLFPQFIKDFASSTFDWILIDSPPFDPHCRNPRPEGQADATLLVARAGNTPREAIEETARNLGRDHIMGIILNGVAGLDRDVLQILRIRKTRGFGKRASSEGLKGLGAEQLWIVSSQF